MPRAESSRADELHGRDLPRGIVTFLFTDIEDSTLLLRELGSERYGAALADHRTVVRESVARHGGIEVDTQGDAFFVAFADAGAAVGAAAEAQDRLAPGPISVRMGVHTGEPLTGPEGYVGEDVHLGARIAAAGHGGQVLISRQTHERAGATLDGHHVVDLGEHRVKGFAEPVWIFQVGAGSHPPLRTISNTNLPRLPSTFVGRRSEIDHITSSVRRGSRLISLIGPGGTGKTRLAIEAATNLVPDFKNGVFWVPLDPIQDPALVVPAIAQTLGAKSDLGEHIGDRQMLLVLDNFEQVIGASRDLAPLLAACPRLQLIVTSRELLRVNGEIEYQVPVMAESESVTLFCERSGLAPSGPMATLCRMLDNLPLAIELAAARTRVMSPAQILERISDRLDLLKGLRDADPRQQTLRATIAWSHDLLERDEQTLFARLAVFRAGCTLEAAMAVAEADIDVLQSLVEKSLVRHPNERFEMLETIRQFATERLAASGEQAALAERHAGYFVEMLSEAEQWITGPEQDAWWQRLTWENENIRAGLEWSTGGARPDIALRLTALMWRYWWQRGAYAEGKRWYEAALELGRDQPELLRAQARSGLGSMLLGTGEIHRAITIFEGCLEVFQRHGDYARTVATLTDLGIAYTDEDRLDAAAESLEKALAMTRAAGDVRRTAVDLINLGDVAMLRGDLDRAAELNSEAFDKMVEVGDNQSAANAVANLALVELLRGDPLAAARHLPEAIQRSRQTDDRYAILHSLITVSGVLAAAGEHSTAAVVAGHVDALQKEMDIAINPTELRLRDETLSRLALRLGEVGLEGAMSDGRALDHEMGIELALQALHALTEREQAAEVTPA